MTERQYQPGTSEFWLRAAPVAPAEPTQDAKPYHSIVEAAWVLHGYRQGTPECVAFDNGAKFGARQHAAPVAPAKINNSDAIKHLRALTTALNGAFISSWQSTHAWQEQLDAAKEFLKEQS